VAYSPRTADDLTIIASMSRISPELVLVDPALAETARALLSDPPDCLAPRPRAVVVPRPVEIKVHRPVEIEVPLPVEIEVPPPVEIEGPLPVAIERRFGARVPRPLDDPPRRRSLPEPAVADIPTPARRRRRRLRARHAALAGVWLVTSMFMLSPLLAFLPAPSSQLPRLISPGSGAAVRQNETTVPVPTPAPKSPKPRTAPSVTTSISWPAVPGSAVYNVIFVAGSKRVDVWTTANRLKLGGKARASARKVEFTWFAYPGFREGKAVRYGAVVAHGTALVAREAIPKTKPPAGGQVR